MTLLNESQLLDYLDYWDTSIEAFKFHPRARSRKTSVETFYLMHYPKKLPELRISWQRTVKEAVNQVRDARFDWQSYYRSELVRDYFETLYSGFVQVYGDIPVFQYRYQNWHVAGFKTMADQLWTVFSLNGLV